jgi:hypothetical protein
VTTYGVDRRHVVATLPVDPLELARYADRVAEDAQRCDEVLFMSPAEIGRPDRVELAAGTDMRQLGAPLPSDVQNGPPIARAAAALAKPCAHLLERVRDAPAVNMDETGWRLPGAQRALWGIFTDRHAVLRVEPDRHEAAPKDLLADTKAIITSDRWWAYSHLPVRRRQVRWSHLQRDFAFHADGRGSEQELGEAGLRICAELFLGRGRSSSTPASAPS